MINRSRSALLVGRGGRAQIGGELGDLDLVLVVEIVQLLEIRSGGTFAVHVSADATGNETDAADNDGLSGDSEEHGIFLVV